MVKFHAIVEPPEPMRGLEIPEEVVQVLGKNKRAPLIITINGHTWESRVAIMRGDLCSASWAYPQRLRCSTSCIPS
jgi:hypothetical protein